MSAAAYALEVDCHLDLLRSQPRLEAGAGDEWYLKADAHLALPLPRLVDRVVRVGEGCQYDFDATGETLEFEVELGRGFTRIEVED